MPTLKNPFRPKHDPAHRWEVLARSVLTFAVFSLPLVVTPWLSDRWELSKAVLWLFLVSVAGLFVLIADMIRRKTAWQWQPLTIAIVANAVIVVLSGLLSVRPWQSFSGFPGWQTESVPVIVGAMVTALLVGRLFQTKGEQILLALAMIGGVGGAVIITLMQVSGFSFLPYALPDYQYASTISGSIAQTAVITALFGLASFYIAMAAREAWLRWLAIAGVVASWLLLLFFGSAYGWVMFGIGMLCAVAWQSQLGKKGKVSWMVVAVVIAAVGMLSQTLQLQSWAGLPQHSELTQDLRSSVTVAAKTLWHRPVLGTGPSTWYQDFVTYRPLSYNMNENWNIRFIQSGNAWSQLVATMGVVGAGAAVAVSGLGIWLAIRRFRKETDAMSTGLLAVTVGSVVMGAITTWSMIGFMWYWVALGILIAGEASKQKERWTDISPWQTMLMSAVAVVVVVLWVPIVRVYASEINIHQAETGITKTKPLDGVVRQLQSALRYNPRATRATALLANAYATKAQIAANKSDRTGVEQNVTAAVAVLRSAMKLDPNNPYLYEETNNLLNALAPFIADVEQEAKANFAKLREIEPASPIHDVGYGQTLMLERSALLSGQSVTAEQQAKADQLFQQALASYNAAIQKKSNYLQAQLSRAEAYALTQRYTQALTELDKLPDNTTVLAERGYVLSKLKRNDEATAAFERSLVVDPTNVSAYVAFADHLVGINKKEEAINVVKQGQARVKDDATLANKLTELTTPASAE